MLQARFAIVQGPARFWDKKSLRNIMIACVILHDIIVEDKSDLDLEYNYDNVGSRVKPARDAKEISAFLKTYWKIENRDSHNQFQHDLIEYWWQLYERRLDPHFSSFLFV